MASSHVTMWLGQWSSWRSCSSKEGVVATSSEGWWSITSGAGGPLSCVSSERGVVAKKDPPSRITVSEQQRGGGCQTKVVVPNGVVYPSSLHRRKHKYLPVVQTRALLF